MSERELRIWMDARPGVWLGSSVNGCCSELPNLSIDYLQARCLAVQVVISGLASHFMATLPRALPPKLVID
jgi:hypothetical protein